MTLQKILLIGLVAIISLNPLGFSEDKANRSVTLKTVRGDVDVRYHGKDWQKAEPGMVLYVSDEIRTGDNGFAEVAMDDGETADVQVDAGSQLKFETMARDSVTKDKTTYLDLAVGRVLIHAQKLTGQSKFEVKTPTSTAGVRGTIFEVVAEEV